MRISSNQLAGLVRQSLAANTEKLYKAQEKVSTQKLVNKPSDDPLAMGRILGYRATLASIEQYTQNIAMAKTSIEFSVGLMEEIDGELQTAKNLAVGETSEDSTSLQQTADSLQDVYDYLLDMANTKLGDNYVFAGYQNGSEVVSCAEVTCSAASELKSEEYFTIGGSSGYYVWYNIDGTGTDPGLTDPALALMTPIEVPIDGNDTASEVAAKTVLAIDGVDDLTSTATTSNPTRIRILDDGASPDIADNSTEFTLHTYKYVETAPFTECAEISFGLPSSIDEGDYFTLGSDYYVWYNTDTDVSSGDPALSGKTGICVDINGAISADDVASRTAQAIYDCGGSGSVFESSVTTDDTTRIEIQWAADGTVPEMAKQMDSGFTLHSVKYNGDDGDLAYTVSKSIKIKANATGDEVFTGDGLSDGVNIFDTLKELKDALEAPTYDEAWISALTDDIIQGLSQVQETTMDLSVAYTRLESSESYWDQFTLTIENMLSEEEDADLAAAIVELQQQETVYEAALSAAAKLFDRSLLDYLG